MDIASLLGLIGALGFIIYAMVSGGVGPFIDVPSLAIVFGGTFFCVMYTCPLPTFLGSFGAAAKAFFHLLSHRMNWLQRWLNWRDSKEGWYDGA